jgi:hypothetical protein
MDRNEVFYFLLNRRHSTVEAQVQFRARLYGSYSALSALEQVFLQVQLFSPAIINPTVLHTLIRKTKGRSLGTIKKQYPFLQSGNIG